MKTSGLSKINLKNTNVKATSNCCEVLGAINKDVELAKKDAEMNEIKAQMVEMAKRINEFLCEIRQD